MELIQRPLTHEKQILMKEETRPGSNSLLTYRLWSVGYGRKSCYRVSITENGNTAEQAFETDAETAVAIFRNAVNATMTPRRLVAHAEAIGSLGDAAPLFRSEGTRNPQEYQKKPFTFSI